MTIPISHPSPGLCANLALHILARFGPLHYLGFLPSKPKAST